MKTILTTLLIGICFSLTAQRHKFIQSPEIYSNAGVKKLSYKFGYFDKHIYTLEFDTSGRLLFETLSHQQNGPATTFTVFYYDDFKLIRSVSSYNSNVSIPAAINNIKPDTFITTYKYDNAGLPQQKELWKNGVIVTRYEFGHNPDVERNFHAHINDSVETVSTFYEGHLLKNITVRHFGASVNYQMHESSYQYKFSGGRISKEMIRKKWYKTEKSKPSKEYDVNFYTYFENGLLKNIYSKDGIYVVYFMYEYF